MRKSAVSLVLLGVLGGCTLATTPGARDVLLAPSKAGYTAGEQITAQISNQSSGHIEFGECALSAERRNGTQWERVGPETIVCPLILLALDPGGARTMVLHGTLLEPGEYRLRFSYARGDIREGNGAAAYSAPFTVISSQ